MSDPGRPVLRLVPCEPLGAEPGNALLTIADIAQACGLPQPVVAQLVPRTWTAEGWMYTDAERQEAIDIAENLRSANGNEKCKTAPGGAVSSVRPPAVAGLAGRRHGTRRR